MFGALAHPTRRAVLQLLHGRGALPAGEIAEQLEVVGPTLSGHLRILREAGLISAEREGTTIRYTARPDVLSSVLTDFLRSLGR